MNRKKIVFLILAVLGFAVFILSLLSTQERRRPDQNAPKTAEALVFSGKLDIRTLDDLRIGGRKILLCGVAFKKPRNLEALAREQARKVYQGKTFECVQVGGATPCDGRAASTFGDAIVAQCRAADGGDLAEQLSKDGYLCDLPAQSGGLYRAC
ncbi:hypothetical protein ACFPLB_04845 [Aquamicrobium segne]|uniref:TNase-like domain-containing protein n=1 Tax=Aquamicrobium segne TaxID=469547 RepID=A0ABW0GUJ1_9HYPH